MYICTVEKAREFLLAMRKDIDGYYKRIQNILDAAEPTSAVHDSGRLAKRRFDEFSSAQPITDDELMRLANYWQGAINNIRIAEKYLSSDDDHSKYHRQPGSARGHVDMEEREFHYDFV